jgi:hypothetical protein
MPSGGKREGAGRKLGSLTKRTREIAEGALASGETPLEYMLRTMTDPSVDDGRRDEMARAAAPFVHARLSSTELKGEDNGQLVVEIIKRTYTDGVLSGESRPALPRPQ